MPQASSVAGPHLGLEAGGSFIFEIGGLSAGVRIGNAGTGAIFIAVSVFGRPMAQNGSSSFLASWALAASGSPTAIETTAASTDRLLRLESRFI